MRDCPYLDYIIILEPILRFTQNEGLPLQIPKEFICACIFFAGKTTIWQQFNVTYLL